MAKRHGAGSRRFTGQSALMLAIGALSLIGFAGVLVLRLRSIGHEAAPIRHISAEALATLRNEADRWEPQAAFFTWAAHNAIEPLASEDIRSLEESEIVALANSVAAWANQLADGWDGSVSIIAQQEVVAPAEVSLLLAEFVRARRGSAFLDKQPIFSPPMVPLRSVLFAPPVPALRVTPEQALVRTIQVLQRVLAQLPPNSRAADAIQAAIAALRRVLVAFDTTPITIAFTAPSESGVLNAIPSISFEMRDSGSGPNPDSRKLEAVNTGPVSPGTTNLTGFTQVTLNDQVTGLVGVNAATISPDAIQDGFIELRASGTDFANNPPTVAVRSIVLDRQPPRITAISPVEGQTFVTAQVPLNASISDQVSGIGIESIRIAFNGVNASNLVVITPGPTNALGVPGTAQMTGVLPAIIGLNQLDISASDFAGNPKSVRIRFTLAPETPPFPPALEIGLSVVSGNGQDGTAGRCADNDLVVRATDLKTGSPFQGVALIFLVVQGGGSIASPASLTDGGGQSNVQFRFGPKPGTNKVRVTAAGFPRGQSVEFVLQGKEPSLTQLNSAGGELPGSALLRTIEVQARAADGTPMVDEEILPEVVDTNGNPIADPSGLGQFHPRSAVTTSEGKARFAFEISKDAPFPDTLHIRFTLPDFRNTQGKVVATPPHPVTVGDPTSKEVGINVGKGQGQIVLPGKITGRKLETFTTIRLLPDEPVFFPIRYTILEGEGSLLEGGATDDGDFQALAFDGQGNVIDAQVAPPRGSNIARIRYQKGSRNIPSLIVVGPGRTDVFVVSVPQAFLVDSSGNPVRRPHASPLTGFTVQDTVKLRILTQLNLSAGPASLKSLDSCFIERGDDGIGLGEKAIDFQTLTPGSSPEPDRHSVFDSDPVLFTSEITEVAAIPSGVKVVHVSVGGAIRCSPKTESIEIGTPNTTVVGILPVVIRLGLSELQRTSPMVGIIRGSDAVESRALQFVLNGSVIAEATTDSDGFAQVTFDFEEGVNLLQVKDVVTRATSFTLPVISAFSGKRHPDPAFTFIDDDQEKKVLEVFSLSETAMNLLRPLEGMFVIRFVGPPDLPANLAGETVFDAEIEKWEVRLQESGNVIAAAVTLTHELKHVEQEIPIRRALLELVAKIPSIKVDLGELFGGMLVYLASAIQANGEYGTAVADGQQKWIDFQSLVVERPAYEQGLKVLTELKAKAAEVNAIVPGASFDGIYKKFHDELGTPLAGTPFIDAVSAHMLEFATQTYEKKVKVFSKAAEVYKTNGVRKHMTDNKLIGPEVPAATRKLLLDTAYSFSIIPNPPEK